MTQMNQGIQSNASAAEELAAAAEEMSSQAKSLEQLMDFFKLAGDNRIGAARSAVLSHANRTGDADSTLPVRQRIASPGSRLLSAGRQTASSMDGEFKHFA